MVLKIIIVVVFVFCVAWFLRPRPITMGSWPDCGRDCRNRLSRAETIERSVFYDEETGQCCLLNEEHDDDFVSG